MDYNFTSINDAFTKASLSPEQKTAMMILISVEKQVSFGEGRDFMEKTMKEAYDEALKNS